MLRRPECVVPLPSGDIYVPEWPIVDSAAVADDAVRGGVTLVRPDGIQYTWRANTTIDLRPNGIALNRDGSFLIANLGDDGGIWRLARDGSLTPFLTEIDGVVLPPANFVVVDDEQRVWMSFSTRRVPRQLAWREDVADGFVAVCDSRGPRIVADGLHYTNEVRPDRSTGSLYVVETFGRRIRRFTIGPDAVLRAAEVVITLDRGHFPDGLALDERGGLWITSLVSNRLIRFAGGRLETIVEDVNDEFVEQAERAFTAGVMHAGHLGRIPNVRLQQLTSVGFGGPDGRTVYLGSLHNSCVHSFRSEIAGATLPHWTYGSR